MYCWTNLIEKGGFRPGQWHEKTGQPQIVPPLEGKNA
jgi:hypothetical protein